MVATKFSYPTKFKCYLITLFEKVEKIELESNLQTERPRASDRPGAAPGDFATTVHFGVERELTVALVEEAEVVDRSVDAELLDESLLGDFGGQGVAEGDVLDAEVSHVDQILGLGVVVVATGFTLETYYIAGTVAA